MGVFLDGSRDAFYQTQDSCLHHCAKLRHPRKSTYPSCLFLITHTEGVVDAERERRIWHRPGGLAEQGLGIYLHIGGREPDARADPS